MRFSSVVLSVITVGCAAGAAVDDFMNSMRRYPDGTVIPLLPANKYQMRYEINQLQTRDPLQFTLMIQAMSMMSKVDQTYKFSYYQLSGIHGRPFKPWNNENTCAKCTQNSGYCVHSGMMFATWHRPYLSLFEQWMWRAAYTWLGQQKLSGNELAQWQSALERLRLPYWDWTQKNGQLPSACTSGTLNLRMPNGKTQSVTNPFAKYTFNWAKGQDDLGPIGQQYPRTTVRSPDNSGNTQNSRSSQVMGGQWGSLRQGVYDMINNPTYKTYRNMVLKLENLHNVVHGAVGNGGHMTYIDVAAFDLIFWLHHCQIDRLFAMWQVVYPSTRFTETAKFHGTFEISSTMADAAQTPLYPFRFSKTWCANENKYCVMDSNAAWQTLTFGYYYPETRSNSAAAVRSSINGNVSRKKKRALAGGAEGKSMDGVTVFNEHQWKATINTDPKACDTTYYVHLFAGKPSSNPGDWLTQPELIGSHVVFGMAPKAAMPSNATLFGNGTDFTSDNDGAMNGMQMPRVQEGTVMLNHHLDSSEAVQGTCPTIIEPYLTKNLQIRVQLATGEEVPLSKLPTLKVGIQSQPFAPPKTPESAPTYGKEVLYKGITKDIIGGLGRCDVLGKGLPW